MIAKPMPLRLCFGEGDEVESYVLPELWIAEC